MSFSCLQIDPLELAIVIAASIVLTLLFDLPMQDVKSVIMESMDAVTVETVEEKKTSKDESAESAEFAKAAERANVFEDDEVASTGWDWQKDIAHGATILDRQDTEEEIMDVPILKKANGRRMSFIDRETYNAEDASSGDRVEATARRSSRDNTEDNAERSKRGQIYMTDDSEEEAIELLRSQREREIATQRNRRSLSRNKNSKRLSSRESESEEEWQRKRESDDDTKQFRRSESRGRASAREVDSWEFVGKEGPPAREPQEPISRQAKPSLAKPEDVAKRIFSSESDEDSSARRSQPKRVPSSDVRTSDEEEWEHELRIRRKQFMEKLVVQQLAENEEGEINADTLKRRSSAEGRIALLSDDLSAEDNMDSWTVSVEPRFTLLGSSQEPSETEDDVIYMRRDYREQGPPSREESQSEEESSQETSRRQSYTSGSQKTSLEEEEDVNYNFILTKDSKKESLQDLSKLSQEELTSAAWNIRKEGDPPARPTSTGLFKRESIVKSQASEEDPEYLLPERPKLVQQEREHPFKKAWQEQKSRSEEEGSSAYAIKDPKEPQSEIRIKEQGASPVKREHSGEQSDDVDSFADEEAAEAAVMLRDGSTDAEDNRTSSKSGTDETDSVSTEYSRGTREEDHRQSSKSETDEDSARFNWPGEEEEEEEEDEIYKSGRRRKSEEADWEWEREET